MSFTEIYKFNKEGNAEIFAEVKNSWRSAMAIWNILDKKYLPKYIPEYAKLFGETDKEYYRSSDVTAEAIKEVWSLNNNKEVAKTDKICLRSTFDNVIVLRNNIPRLLKAFREFEGVTSLKEQADLIQSELKKDSYFLAIAWNQTSVNCDAWESDKVDEHGDYLPYNLNNENIHWELFDKDF